MSNEEDSDELNESLGKNNNDEEDEGAAVGAREAVQQVEDEEEKENSYMMEGRRSSLQQLKRDFYERSKQLKNALTGIQQHQQRLIADQSKESAIVSTKEILKSLHTQSLSKNLDCI